eukprot:GILK01008646.1.p1 GENE.GILK01008646.1~~GILK01008646.1.p1  ORF type:complete len:399 (+),score=41.70 GILK01008646.1:34-1230(+)
MASSAGSGSSQMVSISSTSAAGTRSSSSSTSTISPTTTVAIPESVSLKLQHIDSLLIQIEKLRGSMHQLFETLVSRIELGQQTEGGAQQDLQLSTLSKLRLGILAKAFRVTKDLVSTLTPTLAPLLVASSSSSGPAAASAGSYLPSYGTDSILAEQAEKFHRQKNVRFAFRKRSHFAFTVMTESIPCYYPSFNDADRPLPKRLKRDVPVASTGRDSERRKISDFSAVSERYSSVDQLLQNLARVVSQSSSTQITFKKVMDIAEPTRLVTLQLTWTDLFISVLHLTTAPEGQQLVSRIQLFAADEQVESSQLSIHHIFRRLSEQAVYAADHFASLTTNTVENIFGIVRWLNFYSSSHLFSATCAGCEKRLAMDSEKTGLLPPIIRTFDRGIAYHVQCLV